MVGLVCPPKGAGACIIYIKIHYMWRGVKWPSMRVIGENFYCRIARKGKHAKASTRYLWDSETSLSAKGGACMLIMAHPTWWANMSAEGAKLLMSIGLQGVSRAVCLCASARKVAQSHTPPERRAHVFSYVAVIPKVRGEL